MDLEKIFKLLCSPLKEDKILAVAAIDNMKDQRPFIKKYLNTEEYGETSGPGMKFDQNIDWDCFYIEGKKGYYYIGSDGFTIDSLEQRRNYEKFETKEIWK